MRSFDQVGNELILLIWWTAVGVRHPLGLEADIRGPGFGSGQRRALTALSPTAMAVRRQVGWVRTGCGAQDGVRRHDPVRSQADALCDLAFAVPHATGFGPRFLGGFTATLRDIAQRRAYRPQALSMLTSRAEIVNRVHRLNKSFNSCSGPVQLRTRNCLRHVSGNPYRFGCDALP